MDAIFNIDWKGAFFPTVAIAEIILRGTLVYLSLFFILRLVLKRQSGAFAITDLLVIVLIADAAQNAMAKDYKSIPEGLILVSTIIFWSYFLDWLGYKFPAIQRFVHPPPLLLIKDGQLLRQNLKRELITQDELMNQLRQQGIENLDEVKAAYMEGDGRISVISSNSNQKKAPSRRSG